MSEMMSYDMASGKMGQMDQLLGHCQRLHEEIELLVNKLVSVRSIAPQDSQASPHEAPSNRLHEAILTIEHANLRLHTLSMELNL